MSDELNNLPEWALRLRAKRHELGLTQSEAAKRAGIAVRSLYGWENGQPSRYDRRRKLLAAYGVPWELHQQFFGTHEGA